MSKMELTDALIAKIQFRDEQHNVFIEHMGIESQFEIWVRMMKHKKRIRVS